MELKDGVSCGHRGCLYHIIYPCKGCGRIAGKKNNINKYFCKYSMTGKHKWLELRGKNKNKTKQCMFCRRTKEYIMNNIEE